MEQQEELRVSEIYSPRENCVSKEKCRFKSLVKRIPYNFASSRCAKEELRVSEINSSRENCISKIKCRLKSPIKRTAYIMVLFKVSERRAIKRREQRRSWEKVAGVHSASHLNASEEERYCIMSSISLTLRASISCPQYTIGHHCTSQLPPKISSLQQTLCFGGLSTTQFSRKTFFKKTHSPTL